MDFPDPVAPTMAVVVPCGTVNEMPRSTTLSPKANVRLRNSTSPSTDVDRLVGGGVRDQRLDVEHFEQALPRGHAALKEVADPAERNHRPAQHRQVRIERDELAERHLAGDNPPAAEPEHEQRADAHQQPHAREIESLQPDERTVATDVFLVGRTEPRDSNDSCP